MTENISWTDIHIPFDNVYLEGMWAHLNDIFVVGERGFIGHFDGVAWNVMYSGTTDTLHAIWGFSKSNIFAVGQGGLILHYDGVCWRHMKAPARADLCCIWGEDPSAVWAAGEDGTILHYNGMSWDRRNPTIHKYAGTSHVLTVGGANTEVFFGFSDGRVYVYDGDWRDGTVASTVHDIWGVDKNVVYITTQNSVIKWHNSGRAVPVLQESKDLNCTRGTQHNDIFALHYNGRLKHFNGKEWHLVRDISEGIAFALHVDEESIIIATHGGRVVHGDRKAASMPNETASPNIDPVPAFNEDVEWHIQPSPNWKYAWAYKKGCEVPRLIRCHVAWEEVGTACRADDLLSDPDVVFTRAEVPPKPE